MSITQIPESDQKFIDSLSNIATVEQDKRGRHIYTIRDLNHNCHIQLEFNPDKNNSPSWICRLYSNFGGVSYEEGKNLRKNIQALLRREMEEISEKINDLTDMKDSLTSFSNVMM